MPFLEHNRALTLTFKEVYVPFSFCFFLNSPLSTWLRFTVFTTVIAFDSNFFLAIRHFIISLQNKCSQCERQRSGTIEGNFDWRGVSAACIVFSLSPIATNFFLLCTFQFLLICVLGCKVVGLGFEEFHKKRFRFRYDEIHYGFTSDIAPAITLQVQVRRIR